jgi:hypothetical protein
VHEISLSNSIDWDAVREDFPILAEQAHSHRLIYFDNAATPQKPRAVIDAFCITMSMTARTCIAACTN